MEQGGPNFILLCLLPGGAAPHHSVRACGLGTAPAWLRLQLLLNSHLHGPPGQQTGMPWHLRGQPTCAVSRASGHELGGACVLAGRQVRVEGCWVGRGRSSSMGSGPQDPNRLGWSSSRTLFPQPAWMASQVMEAGDRRGCARRGEASRHGQGVWVPACLPDPGHEQLPPGLRSHHFLASGRAAAGLAVMNPAAATIPQPRV